LAFLAEEDRLSVACGPGAVLIPARYLPQFLNTNAPIAKQLKALPSNGQAEAESVIMRCPYRREGELIQRKIIPQPVSQQITNKTMAKEK